MFRLVKFLARLVGWRLYRSTAGIGLTFMLRRI
jgi:hypothetical protein